MDGITQTFLSWSSRCEIYQQWTKPSFGVQIERSLVPGPCIQIKALGYSLTDIPQLPVSKRQDIQNFCNLCM
jgi:hypothetical protein